MSLPALPRIIIEPLVRVALLEDLGRAGDLTTDAVVPIGHQATALVIARQQGIVAGLDLARLAFQLIDPVIEVHGNSGSRERARWPLSEQLTIRNRKPTEVREAPLQRNIGYGARLCLRANVAPRAMQPPASQITLRRDFKQRLAGIFKGANGDTEFVNDKRQGRNFIVNSEMINDEFP